MSYNLVNRPDNFVAGKTASHKNTWYKITSDRWILKTICGYAVEITCKPYQFQVPTPIKFSDLEQTQIDQELTEFLNKGIIEPVYTEDNEEFISNIFIRPKSDGGIRVILNLKQFNEKFMEKIHFKMESLQSTINAMSKNQELLFCLSRP